VLHSSETVVVRVILVLMGAGQALPVPAAGVGFPMHQCTNARLLGISRFWWISPFHVPLGIYDKR
jgi:hypothetical protein